MSRKLAITIAIVSSLTGVASSAVAGQAASDRNYWPNGVAADRAQLNAASAGPLSALAFDNSGQRPKIVVKIPPIKKGAVVVSLPAGAAILPASRRPDCARRKQPFRTLGLGRDRPNANRPRAPMKSTRPSLFGL